MEFIQHPSRTTYNHSRWTNPCNWATDQPFAFLLRYSIWFLSWWWLVGRKYLVSRTFNAIQLKQINTVAIMYDYDWKSIDIIKN